ncbi:dystrophin-like [Photinus pyralis]|uniref:ZZ-type domain-containing protein n=1 Tax=Photinus pyralis TaxID=7054 RepID=A0A1Y1K440_PHOPY|nr:dystrophin-like [Photinus pyralis]
MFSAKSWKKLENENGFPYYINELTNVKQWDHPKFAEIIQHLHDCNYIKYSAYRVAAKFRALRRLLFMEEVCLSTIAGVFERHKLGVTEGTLHLESYDLEAVLSDIFFAANKQANINTDIDHATELMMNLLYNIYDRDRRDNIQVLSTKIVLSVLSKCNISDLYNFIFELCADHNNCVTRLKLQWILTKFATLAAYLHEDVNFGHHLLTVAIDSCFSNSPGLVGINQSTFISWLESNPQLLAWIPTLHRMQAAEHVVHVTKCSVCKASPLLGLRYRCIKCSNYTQCQQCFLSAKTSNSHKLSHPVKEYCTEGSSRDFTHLLIKKISRLLRCSIKLNAPSFVSNLVEARVLSHNKEKFISIDNETDSSSDSDSVHSPENQLQLVIRQLELQNKELHQMVVYGSDNQQIKKYLDDHRIRVETQIQKLKTLKDYLRTAQPTTIDSRPTLRRMESTPLISNLRTEQRGIGLDMLSPIAQEHECSDNNWGQNTIIGDHSKTKEFITTTNSMPSYNVNDISTWIGGRQSASNIFGESSDSIDSDGSQKSPIREMHNDLDEVLAKLQQILANNFMLDEALGGSDNGQLKNAVTEVEGMLTSLIDGVELSRSHSLLDKTSSKYYE